MRNCLWPKASLKGKRENKIETVIFTTYTLNNGGRIPSAVRFLSFYQSDKSPLLGRTNYKGEVRGRNSIPINSQRDEVCNIIIQKIWEENYLQPTPLRCLPGWHIFRISMGKNILSPEIVLFFLHSLKLYLSKIYSPLLPQNKFLLLFLNLREQCNLPKM